MKKHMFVCILLILFSLNIFLATSTMNSTLVNTLHLNADTSVPVTNQPIITSLHPLVSKSPLSLVSQLCAHPLRGSPTSDLDPSPSLWVLIIGLSVKRQRPSSPAGHRCQSGLRYAEGQQQRETEREGAEESGRVCEKRRDRT